MSGEGVAGGMTAQERVEELMNELRSRADPAAVEGMARYGIATENAFGGSSIPVLRAMAKREGRNHQLALLLWGTGAHEARILATMVDDPAQVTDAQMEEWAIDFASWDLCDQCCSNLFSRTPLGWDKVEGWAGREEAFVKRAAFSLIAALAVHDKRSPDSRFAALLPLIEGAATDERNYVRKAVNWALRQIGKRSLVLNEEAMQSALRIQANGTKAGRWIAADALRELQGEAVMRRLRERGARSSRGKQ